MAKLATEHFFNGTTQKYALGYDSTKTMLGQYIGQYGSPSVAGPLPIVLGRPFEASTAIPVFYPDVIDLGNGTQWCFLADNATAAATRRIVKYTLTKETGVLSWNGFITLTYPAATAHTIRGLKVARNVYTTGTVTVSGTAVTGTSTNWSTNRLAAGARIGFGTTDPNAVTTWYYISAIGSDTAITLTNTAPTLGSASSYVIEELRVYTATTNATATNGGLFVAKGVNANDFTTGGVTIAAATTTDNLKAVYWLADAATSTNTVAGGLSFGASAATQTNHDIYVINQDAATTLRIYKYNGRAALGSLSSGKSTSAFVLKTGQQAVTGTISLTNSIVLATTSHGPGSGTACLYGVTTTRIYRVPEASIIDAATTYVADAMVEIPQGTTNTYAATSAMSGIDYSDAIDRFFITTGSAQKSYVTKYNAISSAFDKCVGSTNSQIEQSTSNSGLTPFLNNLGGAFSICVEQGMSWWVRTGTTAITNLMYVFGVGDWDYQSTATSTYQNRLITPSLNTTGAKKFYRVAVSENSLVGSNNFEMGTEGYKLYYRTSGITDNTGSWTLVSTDGDLSSVTGADAIQFMLEFKVLGTTCIGAKIHGIICTWEDSSTDSHYQPSTKFSDTVNKIFAWRFSTAFGTTVPTLYIRIYNAVTGTLLLTDNTVSASSGTFQKSTDDGVSWSTYNTNDKENETTYIRYTPTSFADNIKARAVISQS